LLANYGWKSEPDFSKSSEARLYKLSELVHFVASDVDNMTAVPGTAVMKSRI
jgi:hypothetical protein